MKNTYLNRKGEVVSLSFKEVGASWRQMNEARVDTAKKEEIEFLKKYGLKPTIFNVSNLRLFEHIHLYPHFVEVVLEHGAIDKRHIPEKVKYQKRIKVLIQLVQYDPKIKKTKSLYGKTLTIDDGEIEDVDFLYETIKGRSK